MVGSGFVGLFCLQSIVWCWSVGLLLFKVCRGPLCGPWFFILPLANPAFSFLHFHIFFFFDSLQDFLNSAWRFRYRTGPKVSLFSQENRRREEDPSRTYVSWSISLHKSFSHVLLRTVLYRRLHPFILALHISQYNHPALNISWLLQFVKIPGLVPDYFVKDFQIPILKTNLCPPVSNSRNDSVASFCALLPCPILISEDQSLWDQISTQDSRFKLRYQNQKLPNWQTTGPTKRWKNIGHLRFYPILLPPTFIVKRTKELT